MMKFLFLLGFSLSALAQTNFRIEDIKCEGIRAEVFTNNCLILATDSKRTQIFILSKPEYVLSNVSLSKGDFLALEKQDYKKVTDVATRIYARRELSHNPHHVSAIFTLDYKKEQVSLNSTQETSILTCKNESFIDHDGFMYGKFFLKAKLVANQNESYTLEDTQLSYFLSMEEDFSDEWASGSYENGTFVNRFNYRPYVYQGYIKFPELFKNEVFGKIDLLLPKTQVKSLQFEAIVMMSHMSDHFGTTITVSCQKELP